MDKWSIASAALPERPTPNGLLSDWARWYFRLQVDGIGAPLTQKAKRQDLEKFLDYFIKAIGDKPVSSWRKPVTQSFINNLKSLTYRSSSISRILATLSSFARYLERQSVISPDDNPLWGVQKPLRSLMKPKHIAIYGPGGELFMEGPAAYDQFLSAANNIIQGQIENGVVRFPRRVWPYRDKALLQFLYHTGLRVAEVCNLDYGHMQPAPYAKARIFKDVVCKGNKERDIFLDEVATLGLEEFFDRERKRGEGPLFPSARERNKKKPAAGDLTMGEYDLARLSTSSVRVILNRIGREACALLGDGYYAKIHPHRLRHERGYNLKMAGADPGDIQKELGHSTPNYAPLYSQPTDNERFEWLNSIAKKQNEGSQ